LSHGLPFTPEAEIISLQLHPCIHAHTLVGGDGDWRQS
jgi:hypothetical protein